MTGPSETASNVEPAVRDERTCLSELSRKLNGTISPSTTCQSVSVEVDALRLPLRPLALLRDLGLEPLQAGLLFVEGDLGIQCC